MTTGYEAPRFNLRELTTEIRSVLAFNQSYHFDRTDLMAEAIGLMGRMVEGGGFQPLATTAYPLDEVARAHRDLELRQTVGKLVLEQ